jgi:hypothetical protein
MAAGLGMAAGRSSHPLVNIGQGGLEGVKVLEQQEQEKARQAQIENEAQNRAATLGIEGQRIGIEGQRAGAEQANQQQMMNYRYAELQRQLKQNDEQFQIKLRQENSIEGRAQTYQEHVMANDAAMMAYKQFEMSMPKPGYGRDAAGNLVEGSWLYNPDTKKPDFTPGAAVGKAPVSTATQEAAQKAAELKDLESKGIERFKLEHPQLQLGIPLPEGEKIPDFGVQAEQEYAKRHGTQQPSAAPAAAAPSAQARIPNDAAIAALKAHPDKAADFDAYYGAGSAAKTLQASP